MKKLCGSPAVYGGCFTPCMLANNCRTNVGFRLAYFIHVMDGRNKVSNLSFFSEHVLDRVDEGEIKIDVSAKDTETGRITQEKRIIDVSAFLRGSIGPRIRWWVGANQYADAAKANAKVKRIEDVTKPIGVDQLRMVCQDIKFNHLNTTSFIIRDPSIDFDESKDIPDLLGGTFTHNGNKLDLVLYYETMGDVINDIWLFSRMLTVVAAWSDLQVGDMSIVCANDLYDTFDTNIEFNDSNSLIKRESEVGHNPIDFFDDFGYLTNGFDQILCMFNQVTLHNIDVDYSLLINMIEKMISEKVKTEYVQDMLRGIVVWTLINKCECTNQQYIMDSMWSMKTCIKYEVAHMTKEVGVPHQLEMVATDILNEFHR